MRHGARIEEESERVDAHGATAGHGVVREAKYGNAGVGSALSGGSIGGERHAKRRAPALAVAMVLALVLGIATSAYAADEDLDPSFGSGGRVTSAIGSGHDDVGYGVAIQPDGKIVSAGTYYNGSNWDFAVMRHNPDGSLDNTFGSGGKVTTAFGSGFDDKAYGVAIQPDGKIVVAGSAVSADPDDTDLEKFLLARFNANGSLDSTFGGDGRVVTIFRQGQCNGFCIYAGDTARDVAIQPDGKIVAAGSYTSGGFAFARYNPDGSPDASFGDGDCATCTGIGTTVVSFGVWDEANSVAIQPDGRIVAGGYTATGFESGSPSDFALARLNSNGSRDTSFDGDGKVTTSFGSGDDVANGVAIQSDGKIVTAGYYDNGPNDDFALARYNANGSPDSTFDGDGKATTAFGSGIDAARGVAVQTDGNIVAAGSSFSGSNYDFALARYNANNGSLDTSFSADGKATTNFGSADDGANGVAIQPDGKIVAAGTAFVGLNYDFALARYEGRTPPPDTTPPRVTSVSPPENGKAKRNVTITASFSEQMNPDSLDGSTVELVNTRTGAAEPATVTPGADNRSVTLDPTAPKLAKSTTYRVTIEGAGDTDNFVKDAAGNGLAQDKVWTFKTGKK